MNLKPLVTNYITSLALIHRHSCCGYGIDLRGLLNWQFAVVLGIRCEVVVCVVCLCAYFPA